MSLKTVLKFPPINRFRLGIVVTLLGLFAALAFVQAQTSASTAANNPPYASSNGTIEANKAVTIPVIQPIRDTRAINFSLTITGTEQISLTVLNASDTPVFSGTVEGGETFWGYTTLTKGTNKFRLQNDGGSSVDYELLLFDIPATPYSWVGTADPDGLNSQIELIFPTSGLYQFDFGVNNGERYEFNLNGDYIEKTVTGDTAVVFYVPAGTHALEIVQDEMGNNVTWQVEISDTGEAIDSLPYAKNGDDILTETLPIFLGAPISANLVITATGDASATLDIAIVDGTATQAIQATTATVETGETFWMTFDLPAGNHLIQLNANNDVVSYDLVIDELPTADYGWMGVANPAGENSEARLIFADAGLYTFDFSVLGNGRYQFLMALDDDTDHIQKTVESSADEVTLYVPAGTHTLWLDQDSTEGADWGVAISLDSASHDSLPYAQIGGDIGSPANDFDTERLPIALTDATTVNMSIETSGDTADSLFVEVYQPGQATPDYTLPLVLGSEKIWTNFDLGAGINYLNIVAADGNSATLSYDLAIHPLPQPGTINWDGLSLDAGDNAVIKVDFPADGLYRFNIESAVGFANLIMDAPQNRPSNMLDTSYDLLVTAGVHDVAVVQDVTFAQTEWSASIMPVTASAAFFTFEGELMSGESVTAQYPVTSGTREFNFALTVVNDGPVDLAITDGSDAPVADTPISVNDGETVWGTGTLAGINKFMLQNNGATAAAVELILYDLPTAGYDWVGVADETGETSHIRVVFPTSGLYTFDSSTANGRFQFMVNDEFIQKTVEDDTNYDVTYFVPAGTHDLYIDQGVGTGIEWGVNISAVGAPSDSLPYHKEGGNLDAEFDTEWLTVNLADPTSVNMAVTLNGDMGDAATVMVYNASDALITSASITLETGETSWSTFDLPAGTSRLTVMADGGNVAPVTYDLTLDAIPTPDYVWDGNTAADGQDSHIRVAFAEAGLYTFDMASNGRYQLAVNDDFILKTVEDGGTSVTYYVPAGTHDLMVSEDTATGAEWNIAISGPHAPTDTLPYHKMGGEIGGNNDFNAEWLPIHLGEDTLVNITLSLTGAVTDSVRLEVWDALTQTMVLAPVYGSEIIWANTELPADARLYLVADGNNADVLAYELAIYAIPEPTYGWSGTSLANGLNSDLQINIPVNGLYLVQLDVPEGSTTIDLNNGAGIVNRPAGLDGFYTEFELEFTAGLHTIQTIQDTDYETTSWTITVTLLNANTPEVIAITPDEGKVGDATAVTITGMDFQNGATVQLVSGATSYNLTGVVVNSLTEIWATVPNNVPLGTYDVVVTNPDTQSGMLADAFSVIMQDAPAITAITPNEGYVNSETAVVITGSGFRAGLTVTLVAGDDEYVLTGVTVNSESEISATVPDTLPVGLYDLVVVNEDEQSDTLADAFSVNMRYTFLPLITK